MNAKTDIVAKNIFWDPSLGPKNLEDKNITYDEKTKLYTLHWGLEFTANKEMIKEWQDSSNPQEYSKRIKGNCGFVFAGNNIYHNAWKPYIENYDVRVVE